MKTTLRSLVLLVVALTYGFAQTTPTAAQLASVGIGVDPNSLKCADPAVQNAIAYLVQLGAPQPACVDTVVPYPGAEGAPYVNSQIQFGPLTFSAGLTAEWPKITASLLGNAGVIKLPATFSEGGYAPYQIAVMPAPVVNVPSGTLPVPTVPIGPKVYPGTPDQVGDEYYTVPRETYQPGATYTDANGRSYIKIAVANPFGSSVFWLRTR